MPVPRPNLYPPFNVVRLSHVEYGVTDLKASPETAQPTMLRPSTEAQTELPKIILPDSMEAVVK